MKNSIAAMHPELIPEWSERNHPLTCSDVSYGSNKRYWWKGKCGHEWETSPKARSAGECCPICSGARVAAGINDLESLCPSLALEWADKSILPSQVTPGSHKKVLWRCSRGHEWTAEIKSRALGGNGCPYCTHNKVLAGFNDFASLFPAEAEDWDYEKNGSLTPEQVTAFSNRKVWWRCGRGHSFDMRIADRAKGHGCPYCNDNKLLPGFNDLKTVRPDIAAEWSERNLPVRPEDISSKAAKSFWWECSVCGHEWKGTVRGRLYGTMCPVCADRKVKAGVNDLAFTDPEIAAEWDFELNKSFGPQDIARHSSKRAWWKCPHGHSWNSIIYMRTLEGQTCTECEKEFRQYALRLMVMYCAGVMGFDVVIDSDEVIGVPLGTYIPEIGLAIEMKEIGRHLQAEQDVKRHVLSKRSITYITLKQSSDMCRLAAEVLECFQKVNVFLPKTPDIIVTSSKKIFEKVRNNT